MFRKFCNENVSVAAYLEAFKGGEATRTIGVQRSREIVQQKTAEKERQDAEKGWEWGIHL
tara:strand:+ start:1100 stop:1279 length:180 start_codon:yes stop_codon:yes gene_type:complete